MAEKKNNSGAKLGKELRPHVRSCATQTSMGRRDSGRSSRLWAAAPGAAAAGRRAVILGKARQGASTGSRGRRCLLLWRSCGGLVCHGTGLPCCTCPPYSKPMDRRQLWKLSISPRAMGPPDLF